MLRTATPSNPFESSTVVETDPRAYVYTFFQSDTYQNAYNRFYSGKRIDPDVTDEDMHRVFWENEKCRQALMEYAFKSQACLSYYPNYYSGRTNEAVATYFDHLAAVKKGDFENTPQGRTAADRLRTNYHNDVADNLSRDIGVSTKIGGGLVQIMSIEKGLENWNAALASESDRRGRSYERW